MVYMLFAKMRFLFLTVIFGCYHLAYKDLILLTQQILPLTSAVLLTNYTIRIYSSSSWKSTIEYFLKMLTHVVWEFNGQIVCCFALLKKFILSLQPHHQQLKERFMPVTEPVQLHCRHYRKSAQWDQHKTPNIYLWQSYYKTVSFLCVV